MTNTELINSIATRILDTDDALDIIIDMRPMIIPALFADLMLAIDFCPMHACDAAICADDDIAECAELRA